MMGMEIRIRARLSSRALKAAPERAFRRRGFRDAVSAAVEARTPGPESQRHNSRPTRDSYQGTAFEPCRNKPTGDAPSGAAGFCDAAVTEARWLTRRCSKRLSSITARPPTTLHAAIAASSRRQRLIASAPSPSIPSVAPALRTGRCPTGDTSAVSAGPPPWYPALIGLLAMVS